MRAWFASDPWSNEGRLRPRCDAFQYIVLCALNATPPTLLSSVGRNGTVAAVSQTVPI